MASGSQVEVEGLRELRRDLRKLDKQLPRELNKRLRKVAEPVRRDAAIMAPKRKGILPSGRKHFADTLKVATRGSAVVVRSTHPAARIIHYGGRHPLFGNKDHWFPQKGNMVIVKAALKHTGRVESEVLETVEDLMTGIGFRR